MTPLERIERLLSQIAGKNDFSGSSDEELLGDAQNAVYECELLAREALEILQHHKAMLVKRNTDAVRRIMFAKISGG